MRVGARADVFDYIERFYNPRKRRTLEKIQRPDIRIVSEAEVDKEKLSELISIVDDATKSNNQKAQSIRKINGLAEVAVSLIGKLV